MSLRFGRIFHERAPTHYSDRTVPNTSEIQITVSICFSSGIELHYPRAEGVEGGRGLGPRGHLIRHISYVDCEVFCVHISAYYCVKFGLWCEFYLISRCEYPLMFSSLVVIRFVCSGDAAPLIRSFK